MLASTFLLGACIGSFLNVVVHRLPLMLNRAWKQSLSSELQILRDEDDSLDCSTREEAGRVALALEALNSPTYNLALPHSHCPKCGRQLQAWENIPVVSYVLLRGRCSSCKTHISLRYPAIELVGGVLAVLSVLLLGQTLLALAGFLFCMTLLAIALIDAETMLVPDSLSLPLLWFGVACSFAGVTIPLHTALLGAAAGYAIPWASQQAIRMARGSESIGQGDLKLTAAIGAWLGITLLIQSLLFAALTAAGYFLIQHLVDHKRRVIPFGPFLAAGAVASWFAGRLL